MRTDGIRPGVKTVLSTVSWGAKPAISAAGQKMLKALTAKGLELVIPQSLEVYDSKNFLGLTGFASPAASDLGNPFLSMEETPRQTFERELRLAKRDEIDYMLEKGEVLIALDSHWHRGTRENLSRLPELLAELKPVKIELVVEQTNATWEKQTAFIGLKLKLHPADIRSILAAREQPGVVPANSLLAHIDSSLRMLLEKHDNDYRYSIGGGRAYVHFKGFEIKKGAAQIEIKLTTQTTRIEIDGAPPYHEEHSFTRWLLNNLWKTWLKPAALASNQFDFNASDGSNKAFAGLAEIPVLITYDGTIMGFVVNQFQKGIDALVIPNIIPKSEMH